MADPTAFRKNDHMELCAGKDVRFRDKTTLLEEVDLLHEALPGFSLASIDLSTEILGRKLSAPILISAMSGGIPQANEMNRALADIARKLGVGLGLGSQRLLLEGGDSWPDFRKGPEDPLLILGNIGLAQARMIDARRLNDLVARVGADALCVHLNPAHEWFQPEGDRDFGGSFETLARLSAELTAPLMVKETGCGISEACALRLKEAGVRHLDVAGAGGTTWIGVELERKGNPPAWTRDFREWGIPTAASVIAAAQVGFQTLFASGGIRSGLDVAKTLALGADAAGLALPVLKAWRHGGKSAVETLFQDLLDGLRTAMALTGSRTPSELRGRYVITGTAISAWLEGMTRAAREGRNA